MPTYQYVCTECAEPLEVVQSFSDAPLTECPACEGRLRKVFSAVGVVFKGSGFYKTDSRSGSSSTSAGSSAGSEGSKPTGDKGGDKPTADKPAAAPASAPAASSAPSAPSTPAAKSA